MKDVDAEGVAIEIETGRALFRRLDMNSYVEIEVIVDGSRGDRDHYEYEYHQLRSFSED